MPITFTNFSAPAGTGGAHLTFPPLRGLGYAGSDYAEAKLSFPGLTLSATGPAIGVAHLSLPSLQLLGGGAYSQAKLHFEPVTLSAGDLVDVVPSYAIGDLSFTALTMWGHGLAGGSGSAALHFPALKLVAAQTAYAGTDPSRMHFLPLQMFGLDAAARGNFLLDRHVGRGRFKGRRSDRAAISALFQGKRQQGAARVDALQIAVQVRGKLRGKGKRQELLRLGFRTLFAGTQSERQLVEFTPNWAFNAETFAPSRYLLPVTEYVNHGGRVFAVVPGGIVELTGENDAGDPIGASIQLARQDSGTMQRKRYARLYVQGSSQGFAVSVSHDEGKSFTYQSRGGLHGEGAGRAKLGRGPDSQFLRLLVRNREGTDFHWHRVDLLAESIKRRVKA